jgi:hypothetical protein
MITKLTVLNYWSYSSLHHGNYVRGTGIGASIKLNGCLVIVTALVILKVSLILLWETTIDVDTVKHA